MTTPTEALKLARNALDAYLAAFDGHLVTNTNGARDFDFTGTIAESAKLSIAAIDALAQQASVPGAEPLTADQESRCMFVARLGNMQQNGHTWLTIPAVLALLNDCDMLASLHGAAPTAPAAQADATASVAGLQNRTLLQQYDREQLPGYHAGYEDGRLKGYEVGKRHAAPQAAPVAPDGRLHADGYFAWARRDGYVLDRKLPCDFWLTPPAPVAPTVQPLPARLVRFTLRDLKAERKRLDGFISFGNEIKRAAEYDEWIAAIEAYCTAHGITAATTKE